MIQLAELVTHLDTALESRGMKDYAPNGLQVEGRPDVRKVATGVSANQALIEAARAWGADALVVHHGLIWGGGIERVVGPTAARLRALLGAEMSLVAYHLPLDRHATLGNNAGLCDALGLGAERTPFGEVRGSLIGSVGELPAARPAANLAGWIADAVLGGKRPPFVFAGGPTEIRRVAVCSGAAADLIEDARRTGADLYLTGELAERAGELARELGIHLVAAGHYATEVYGPQRLAAELTRRFPAIETRFIDVPSPL